MDVTIEVELDEAQVARLDVLAAETNQPRQRSC